MMVYCAPLGRIPIPPSVDYVRGSVEIGVEDIKRGKLRGVVTYKLTKSGLSAPATENYARTGAEGERFWCQAMEYRQDRLARSRRLCA